LGISRFCVLCFPFRYIALHLGKLGKETDLTCKLGSSTKVQYVAWGIEKVWRHTPWSSNCLAKAITGKMMLKRRHIPSTLYMGLKKSENGLEAHAWLRVGKNIITGNDDNLSQFRVVGSFGYF
jgi:hypothetical protein